MAEKFSFYYCLSCIQGIQVFLNPKRSIEVQPWKEQTSRAKEEKKLSSSSFILNRECNLQELDLAAQSVESESLETTREIQLFQITFCLLCTTGLVRLVDSLQGVPTSFVMRKFCSLLNTIKIFFFHGAHCLKITQNVAFEFLNFDIFHQFLSY